MSLSCQIKPLARLPSGLNKAPLYIARSLYTHIYIYTSLARTPRPSPPPAFAFTLPCILRAELPFLSSLSSCSHRPQLFNRLSLASYLCGSITLLSAYIYARYALPPETLAQIADFGAHWISARKRLCLYFSSARSRPVMGVGGILSRVTKKAVREIFYAEWMQSKCDELFKVEQV